MLDSTDDRRPFVFIQDGILQRNREKLIRTTHRIVAARFGVHDIVQVTALLIPEAAVERRTAATRVLSDTISLIHAFGFSEPFLEQAQGVVPKRVYLNRFAAPRCHYPAVHLRVHPSKLVALLAL